MNAFVDTHAHIHSRQYGLNSAEVVKQALGAGVAAIICPGTNIEDSKDALAFACQYSEVYCAIGIHPHQAGSADLAAFEALLEQSMDDASTRKNVVAIGECGLDYYYQYASTAAQKKVLAHQVKLAERFGLPLSLHVRGSRDDPQAVWQDVWKVMGDAAVKGVIHSFSCGQVELDAVLYRGLIVGFNGLITFVDDEEFCCATTVAPLQSFVLETDAPYLTPAPKRGKINMPDNIPFIAQKLCDRRGESIERLAQQTTQNAIELFGITI